MADDELFTRDEVVGGLPARRAATLLFLIESRTAHMVVRSQQDAELFLTEETAKERELAFLEAFAMGQDPPLRPTIQNLERHASHWAPLVPANPSVRAAVAHLMGQKYTFTAPATAGIQAALGLGDEAVRRAYLRLYREPLEALFAPQAAFGERLRWMWSSLARWPELLSPFWTAFTLTVALGLPQACLGLPIAVAHIGPLPGIGLLVAFGLINVLTMACMAEACTRSGVMHYGRAFLGRMVTDFLGNESSIFLTVTSIIRTFLVLLASAIGLGITLETWLQVHAEVWILILFIIQLYMLVRGSFTVPVSTMLLLLGVNLSLFLAIVWFALPHVQQDNLWQMNIPFFHGEPFDPSLLQLLFGIILMLYFGHVYVLPCAKIVLPRESSGRALIWGSVAGTASLIALLVLWVWAIGGAVAREDLINQAGTVVTPLAQHVGPGVHVLGTLFVVCLIGVATLRSANVLFNLVHERLPTQMRSVVMLLRRRGSVLLRQRGGTGGSPGLRLTYLGLTSNQLPQFRLDIQLGGHPQRVVFTVDEHWDVAALIEQVPVLGPYHLSLMLHIQEGTPAHVRLLVTSSMSLAYEGGWDTVGLHLTDALTLSEPQRHLVNWMMRQRTVSLSDVMAHTGQDKASAQTLLDALIEQEVIQRVDINGTPRFRISLAPRRGRQIPQKLWQALADTDEQTPPSNDDTRQPGTWFVPRWLREVMLGERGRFWVALSPVVLVFLIAEWLLLNGTASFARVLSFAGVIANSLTAGIFPILLLLASRRKGDVVPGVVYRFLEHPILVATIYLLFLANLFIHGLVIWRHPLPRVSAVLFGLASIALTFVMVRRGAFYQRLVVELRDEQREGGSAVFNLLAGGQPVTAKVQLSYPDREQDVQSATGDIPSFATLRHITFQLPPTAARELKVWAHSITPEGLSESLPTWLEIHDGDQVQQFDMQLSGGQIVIPSTGAECRVRISRAEPASA